MVALLIDDLKFPSIEIMDSQLRDLEEEEMGGGGGGGGGEGRGGREERGGV